MANKQPKKNTVVPVSAKGDADITEQVVYQITNRSEDRSIRVIEVADKGYDGELQEHTGLIGPGQTAAVRKVDGITIDVVYAD